MVRQPIKPVVNAGVVPNVVIYLIGMTLMDLLIIVIGTPRVIIVNVTGMHLPIKVLQPIKLVVNVEVVNLNLSKDKRIRQEEKKHKFRFQLFIF